MRFVAIAAFLAFGLVMTAPSLPHNNGIARGANDITKVFEPQESCIVVLFKGALLCIEDINNFDDGRGSTFPDSQQLKPYADYRNCLLRKEPGCKKPLPPELTEAVLDRYHGMDINELAREFERTHPGYRLENILKGFPGRRGNIFQGFPGRRGKEDTGENDVEDVSVN